MLAVSKIIRRHLSLSSVLAGRITRVPLPALSPTMESGSIVTWDKKEGDRLNDGDLLAEIETDKATMAFETPEEGFLAKILIPAGTKGVLLGKPLCIIVEEEEDLDKFKELSAEQAIAAAGGPVEPAGGSAPPQESQPTNAPAPQPVSPAPLQSQPPPPQVMSPQPTTMQQPTLATSNSTERIFASPLARFLAKEANLQLPSVGSGPNGRVQARDLQGAVSAQPVSAQSSQIDFIDIPLTGMRQTIAKRLTQSKQTVPHYYLTVNLKVDELLKLRQKANQTLSKDGVKLSVNDFIIKAAALACKRVPQVNSMWQESFIRQYSRVDVCVAVSTDSGLITPIVFNAENKGVQEIGVEVKSLAEKARQGKLQPHEFQGGTFTISNLGMFDISHFTAVINPPQSAILAVGNTQKVLVPTSEDGSEHELVSMLNVTLSCDHRVVDGAVGAQWLQWFRKYMEQPYNMLIM